MSMYKHFFKRFFDLLLVIIVLICIGWFLIIIAFWLHFVNKEAGVFFTQNRPGKNAKIFKMIKFKSMTDERDKNGNLLPDSQRLTSIGRFLRSTSIDELPQLINVLRGDMALIGPRPLLLQYIPLYTTKHARRHEVRPGITGWAQVQGRNQAKLSQRFENDVWYVDHCSPWIDIKIAFLSVFKLFNHNDVGKGAEDMPDVDDLHFEFRIRGHIREYGSDYHLCETLRIEPSNSVASLFPNPNYYGNGRNAIEGVIHKGGYKRIWMPKYFCYTVINRVRSLGIEILFYDDNPLRHDDDDVIAKLPFKQGDVLFRMNYFGLRLPRDNSNLNIPVIEDHSHDLLSQWAQHSNADWCVASLRKILPIASGGIAWSPKGYDLPVASKIDLCKEFASLRYEAMDMKKEYLKYSSIEKKSFRDKYFISESILDNLPFCQIDDRSYDIVTNLDLEDWIARFRANWKVCIDLLIDKRLVLQSEDEFACNPFSLVLLCDTAEQRNVLRSKLIANSIYPAILWPIPYEDGSSDEGFDFYSRMLSIHCDARFTEQNIKFMAEMINSCIGVTYP